MGQKKRHEPVSTPSRVRVSCYLLADDVVIREGSREKKSTGSDVEVSSLGSDVAFMEGARAQKNIKIECEVSSLGQ